MAKEHWRLGCQVKVKENLKIHVPESVLGVKKWECEVISNRNISTFLKEFVVKLPEGENLKFRTFRSTMPSNSPTWTSKSLTARIGTR